jgi:hypothetical protein
MEQNNFDCFPTLNHFLKENKCELDENIHNDIMDHLQNVYANLIKYLPDINSNSKLDSKSIQCKRKDCMVFFNRACLTDITSDSQFVQKFKEVSLITFWGSLCQEYSALSRHVIHQLQPCASTYLCTCAKNDTQIMQQQKQNTQTD